jgi:hypothetical protein
MASEINKWAYEKLINEDIEWLLKQPRTLEREHIEVVLRHSPDRYYGIKDLELENKRLKERIALLEADLEKERRSDRYRKLFYNGSR